NTELPFQTGDIFRATPKPSADVISPERIWRDRDRQDEDARRAPSTVPWPSMLPAQIGRSVEDADAVNSGPVHSGQEAEHKSIRPDRSVGPTSQVHSEQRFTVCAGWKIPAILLQGINSDLRGQSVAQVSQNVYDCRTGKFLLIPQGSTLFGDYNSTVG